VNDVKWRERVDLLLAKQEVAIRTFQWITNNIPMTAEQRVRLGDAIVSIYDEGESLRSWMANREVLK
jgi:hypothetical protein